MFKEYILLWKSYVGKCMTKKNNDNDLYMLVIFKKKNQCIVLYFTL